MSRKTFDIGDRPVVTCLFTTVAGVAADPTAIEVKTKDPAGTVTTYTHLSSEVANTTVGTWTFTFTNTLADSGPWSVKFSGTATLEASAELTFNVRESAFA